MLKRVINIFRNVDFRILPHLTVWHTVLKFQCPSAPPPLQKIQIWILCQNSLTRELKIRVVGFVLKKLLTYSHVYWNFECSTCSTLCILLLLYLISFDTVWHTVLVLVPHPPPPPPKISDLDSLSKFTY